MKRYILFSLVLIMLSFAIIDTVEAYCGASSVTYISCPSSGNTGKSITIWIKYKDAGEDFEL
jgi:hypothetical protein